MRISMGSQMTGGNKQGGERGPPQPEVESRVARREPGHGQTGQACNQGRRQEQVAARREKQNGGQRQQGPERAGAPCQPVQDRPSG